MAITSVMVDTFGTGKISETKLVDIIRETLICVRQVLLRCLIYADRFINRRQLTVISEEMIWIFHGEKTDKVELLKKYL